MRKSFTILYMDDDLDDLMLISEAFAKYSEKLTIIHAFNGEEGIKVLNKMAEEHKLPCLIILDINMPIMDGKQALKLIRCSERLVNIPIVLFSTSNSEENKRFAEEWRATFYSKPQKLVQMEDQVRDFVNYCNLQVDNYKDEKEGSYII